MSNAASNSRRASAESRSSRGCWTCKLRRKKCDEQRPACLRCSSVSLICENGTKPAWFGDESRSRRELERIKAVVKASATRKRAAALELEGVREGSTVQTRSQPPVIRSLSPLLREARSSNPMASRHAVDISPRVLTKGSSVLASGQTTRFEKLSLWPQLISDQEADLMMHYLDQVFYVQFRFYRPSIAGGGRGWLLSLLTQTKPLYHAALSLSAFHQKSLLCSERSDAYGSNLPLDDLKRHHELTLRELRLFIQAHGQKGNSSDIFEGNIQILACMVQLISFELFDGGVSNWQVHLLAASDLVVTLHQTSMDRPFNASLRFLTGAIVWFDTLACVSTGAEPHLKCQPEMLLGGLDGSPKIKLENIMGCENWAIVLIGEIAQLAADAKIGSAHNKHAVTPRVSHSKGYIKTRLEAGTMDIDFQLKSIHEEFSGPPLSNFGDVYDRYITLIITGIFASAATLYLQSSIPNVQPSIDQETSLQQAKRAFDLLPDKRMSRNLVWPLCVAGCLVVSHSDQEFFRRYAAAAIEDSGPFGNSGRASEILEKSWQMRADGAPQTDCATCIKELGKFVLLV